MSIEASHLSHVMRTLGDKVLNLEFPDHTGDVVELASGFTWAGIVQSSGGFVGGVALRCGTPVALALTRGLLQEEGSVSDESIGLTLTELAQLLAGAVAPILDERGEGIELAPARSLQGAAVARMGESAQVVARSLLSVEGGALDLAIFRVG